MADSKSSHVQAFIGHLLTDPGVRAETATIKNMPEAEQGPALTAFINKLLGTQFGPEEAAAVAKEVKARLGDIKAAPQTVAEAEDNIVG